jgi:CheY-like chemotaxis protein
LTKLLIVDDEPAQSKGLLRAILLRRPEYTVLTSASGAEAIAILEKQHIDLVVTDLQMAEMDGFQLLAWLLNNRPSTLAFAMTAYGSEETQARLEQLGAIECFSKPLDIDALFSRLSEGIAQSIQGHVQNVGLASFLQLIELERKTCTLEVRSAEHVGSLYLRRGELLHARTAGLDGEAAALAIIGWINASIAIQSGCRVRERTIFKPVYHIVMESMRIHDEGTAARTRSEPNVRDSFFSLHSEFPGSRQRSEGMAAGSGRALGSLHLPFGALTLAVIDMTTSSVLASENPAELSLAPLAQAAVALMQKKQATLAIAASHERVEEVATMGPERCELIRPMENGEGLILLVFDPNQTNLVMARLELDLFEVEYKGS